jgi:uncharacterized protein (TIGR02145 family)
MNILKKSIFVFCLLFIVSISIKAQVGIGTTSPNASAQLDVSSTTKGFLPPRMTTVQRDAISNPATGLVIFNTTTNGLEIRNSSGWLSLSVSSASQDYPSIKIGTQVWMTENLNVTTYRDGTAIPEVQVASTWSGLATGAWCYYDNSYSAFPFYGDAYGKLYNWYAAMGIYNAASLTNAAQRKNICPTGWHVPSNADWTTLGSFLGLNAGGKLKAAGWNDPNMGATNSSGFTGLPGGARNYLGAFIFVKASGHWWSTTEFNAYDVLYSALYYDNSLLISYNYDDKRYGKSVRCIKD